MNVKDISRNTGLSEQMIRHYEKKNILHPDRGENNYRQYRNIDVFRAVLARTYNSLGIPLQAIPQFLDNPDLCADRTELQAQIERMKEEEAWLHERIRYAQDLQDSFAAIEKNHTHVLARYPSLYYYPQSESADYAELFPNTGVSKAVKRISFSELRTKRFTDDIGIVTSRAIPNARIAPTLYKDALIYRAFTQNPSGRVLNPEEIHILLQQIEKEGYRIIGDAFEYMLFTQNKTDIVCVDFLIQEDPS